MLDNTFRMTDELLPKPNDQFPPPLDQFAKPPEILPATPEILPSPRTTISAQPPPKNNQRILIIALVVFSITILLIFLAFLYYKNIWPKIYPPALPPVTKSLQLQCEKQLGHWLADYSECENIDESACIAIGGTFNPCASPCRNTKSDYCAEVCIPVCTISTSVSLTSPTPIPATNPTVYTESNRSAAWKAIQIETNINPETKVSLGNVLEIKYPQDWYYLSGKKLGGIGAGDFISNFETNKIEESLGEDNVQIQIFVLLPPENGFDRFANSYEQSGMTSPVKININGFNGYKGITKTSTNYLLKINESNIAHIYITPINTQFTGIVDQILSTFRFLDPSKPSAQVDRLLDQPTPTFNSAEKQVGYINSINNNTISVDYVQWINCQTSDCPNGYKVINDNTLLRDFVLSPNLEVLLQTYSNTTNGDFKWNERVNLNQLTNWKYYKSRLYWFTFQNNQITIIEEQYQP